MSFAILCALERAQPCQRFQTARLGKAPGAAYFMYDYRDAAWGAANARNCCPTLSGSVD